MIYLFLAKGFEEIEALAPVDLLRRAGKRVATVAVGSEREVVGAHGIAVKADMTIDETGVGEDAEMLILPGGMPGTKNLAACKRLSELLVSAANDEKTYIAAICAAPSVLGGLGILKGKKATCYPGFEAYLEGALISDESVVADGRILTAAGMGVAVEFGLAAVKRLCGEETAERLRGSVVADR